MLALTPRPRFRTEQLRWRDQDALHLRVDIWDQTGNSIVEQVAGVDDFEVAVATYGAAVALAAARITLRHGARVVYENGQRR
jgi:hypothetical protein